MLGTSKGAALRRRGVRGGEGIIGFTLTAETEPAEAAPRNDAKAGKADGRRKAA